jgi:hypothetical protein
VVACLVVIPAVATAGGPHTCSGTSKKPGVLAGTYPSGVVVSGVCEVNAGNAHVDGTLKLNSGSVLVAAFGLDHVTKHGGSRLEMKGNVVVGKGATLLLGCNPAHFACVDDNQHHPKLFSRPTISGNLTVTSPLGVVVHSLTIGGNIKQTGGGGGESCTPAGLFKTFKSPVYSAYENSLISGSVSISNLKSCWLGVTESHIAGSLSLVNDQLADPDAIEVLANRVGKNLSCTGNSMVWDSVEISHNSTFPRASQPNTVLGTRGGQCVHASPTTMGGPAGPGPF